MSYHQALNLSSPRVRFSYVNIIQLHPKEDLPQLKSKQRQKQLRSKTMYYTNAFDHKELQQISIQQQLNQDNKHASLKQTPLRTKIVSRNQRDQMEPNQNTQPVMKTSCISLKLSEERNIDSVQQVSTNKKRSFWKNRSKTMVINTHKSIKIEDFEQGQLLGKGSFGSVHLARHKETCFVFAMKKINKSKVTDIEQVITGIKSQYFLDHPNICKLYAIFSDDKFIYLLLELSADENLAKYKKKISSIGQKKSIVLGVANGIKYMHQELIRHGDLKLENILISYGVPKITDFDCVFTGNQKSFIVPRRKSKLWGSPAYFSPEMIKESTFKLKDDIWSLGIIMYQLFCNSYPFSIRKSSDLTKIINQNYKPIPETLNENVKILIKKMLEKNWQNRASLRDVLQFCNQSQ